MSKPSRLGALVATVIAVFPVATAPFLSLLFAFQFDDPALQGPFFAPAPFCRQIVVKARCHACKGHLPDIISQFALLPAFRTGCHLRKGGG